MAKDGSPWKVVGIGCLIVVAIGFALAVAGGLWAYRTASRFKAEMEDPVLRVEKAKKILGTEELPEGYNVVAAFSLPLVFELAILTDHEPDPKGMVHDLGERSLIYVEMIGTGRHEQELRDYFEGKTSDPKVLRDNRIHIDVDEIIKRGVVPLDDASLMYVAQRGKVSAQGFEGQGVTSMCLVDCPGDARMRMAIWSGPDPDPEIAVAELDLSGTPADPARLAEFMGRFEFCK